MRLSAWPKGAASLLGAITLLSSLAGAAHAQPAATPPVSAPVAPVAPVPLTAPAPAPNVELARTERELGVFAARARFSRLTYVVTGVVSGAVFVPAGIVLTRRSDSLSQALGTGMIIGGAVPLALTPLGLLSSPVEKIHATVLARRAAGDDEAEILRSTEEAWSAAAQAARKRRPIVGGVNLALGAACAVTGLVMLLAPPGVGGLSQSQQATVGSSLVGPGIPLIASGLRSLLVESDEETSWAAHLARRDVNPTTASVPVFNFGLVRGGAVAVTSFTF